MSTAATAPTTRNLVEFLQDPASYPEHPARIETIETHISWVFLTDHCAYKLKKPVEFKFLDFSQPQARKLACAEEIRLNRRLARNVYIAVLPITFESSRGLALNGSGPEVDYVVQMRRLSGDCALSHHIEHRKRHHADIGALSKLLVDFYICLPPKVLQPQDHYQHLVDHCEANLADLIAVHGPAQEPTIRRVQGAQKRYLALQADLFYDRVRDGRVVDGHGDLRAEHVYLESPPAIIDCVEFSDELREVDVLDDLSFLALDCQRLGNSDIGRHLLEAYQEASNDDAPTALVAFYKCYRACVRAKVAALRAAQAGANEKSQCERENHQYLNWADYYAAQLGRPALVIMGGLMGTGKSTLATHLADALGAELISTDQLRRSQFGRSTSPADYGAEIYQSDLRLSVYDELLARAGSLLDEGRSVVLDGTFLTNRLRSSALEQAKRHGACGLLVECVCPQAIAIQRIEQRAAGGATHSEARPELYHHQLQEYETLESAMPALFVDSTASLGEELQTVYSALRARLFTRRFLRTTL